MEQLTENLDDRQHKALLALLDNPTIKAAAEAAGIGRSTLHRYLKDPEFAAARRAMLADALSNATARLKAEAEASVKVLAELRDGSGNPSTARLGACRAVLDYAYHADTYDDLLTMIGELNDE